MHITATDSITIYKSSQTVFNFIADLQNDKQWRKEINGTTMQGTPQLGARDEEDSFLSKRTPSHVLQLVCTAFTQNQQVVYETVPQSKFYLKSIRQVEAVSLNETKVTYTITFDKGIVKQGLGFNLPTFIVNLVAGTDLKKYLAKLKQVLEAN